MGSALSLSNTLRRKKLSEFPKTGMQFKVLCHKDLRRLVQTRRKAKHALSSEKLYTSDLDL